MRKGRKLENILNSLTQILDELIFRKPAILVLDHFDELFPNDGQITDANILFATKKLSLCNSFRFLDDSSSQCFRFSAVRQIFERIQKAHRQIIFIPIARQISAVHQIFTESTPLFYSQTITIEPLNAVSLDFSLTLLFQSSFRYHQSSRKDD